MGDLNPTRDFCFHLVFTVYSIQHCLFKYDIHTVNAPSNVTQSAQIISVSYSVLYPTYHSLPIRAFCPTQSKLPTLLSSSLLTIICQLSCPRLAKKLLKLIESQFAMCCVYKSKTEEASGARKSGSGLMRGSQGQVNLPPAGLSLILFPTLVPQCCPYLTRTRTSHLAYGADPGYLEPSSALHCFSTQISAAMTVLVRAV